MSEGAGEGVAVVGMSALFPEAPGLSSYWQNISGGVDAIREVPPSRWDPALYTPEPSSDGRIYCRRGGFVDEHATFDPVAFGLMPVTVDGAEPDQLLALRVAAEALRDAGDALERVDRRNVGVILGRGGYLNAGVARLDQRVRTATEVIHCLESLLPDLPQQTRQQIEKELAERLGPLRPEASIGLVPNLAASRISNRLDLQGPAYTVDAACASSLLAVDHAMRELESGRCDLVVAGGVHHCHDATFWSVFSQLRALSPSGRIRPFDTAADGLLIGEGTGMIVLKRLDDARRDEDRIYAVIRGTGVSSDGRGPSVMTPGVDGQVLALERAWRAARCDPASIGLLEAHGTATPAGDEAELTTLERFFGGPGSGPRPGIGSVKSMIGHTMPAAGMAGLIKAALALHHKKRPPTLHCDDPHPLLEQTRFRAIREVEDWEDVDGPRRAGVNAFGFGGINAHAVLEEAPVASRARALPAAAAVPDAEVVQIFAAADVAELTRALDAWSPSDASGSSLHGHGPVRLAIANPTAKRLAMAHKVVGRGRAWRGRNDIWFSPAGLLTEGGKIALLFPGVEPVFDPEVDDIADHFGFPRQKLSVGASGEGSEDLEDQGFAIVQLSRLLHRVSNALGVRPHCVAGHSIGEWSGMLASEMIPADEADGFIASLERGALSVPDAVYLAAGCGVELAEEVVADLDGAVVSHDNCPHQCVICGRAEAVAQARSRLRERKVLCEELPFRSGFHSPFVGPHLDPYLGHIQRVPLQRPRLPLWSATTCAPYPEDEEELRALVTRHYLERVRFRELVRALYADGVRVFLQLGMGSLTGFVGDSLSGEEHLAVTALAPKRSGMGQLRRAVAALFVEGADLRVDRLFECETDARSSEPRLLELGAPPLRLGALARPLGGVPSLRSDAVLDAAGQGDPLADEFSASLREIEGASRAVMGAWKSRRGRVRPAARRSSPEKAAGPRERRVTHVFSLEAMPELADHCFYKQPADWSDARDRFPVVPMTALVQRMADEARRLVPDAEVVAVEEVRALRWLAVAPPAEVAVSARYDGESRVKVVMEGYARGTVVLAPAFPEPTASEFEPIADPRPSADWGVDVASLYRDRWMFHGPRYQGVVALGPLGDNGIRGEIEVKTAPGAVLDNAGQLMGLWVMLRTEEDRLALPTHVKRIRFFSAAPSPGATVECEVRIAELEADHVTANLEITCAGRPWVRIEGWTDRRFESDDIVWPVYRDVERNLLSDPGERPYAVVRERWRSAASRELMMRRYLNAREREAYESKTPRAQREWLLGRIAAKEAVRSWFMERGRTLFPVEISVSNDEQGAPQVEVPGDTRLRVSLAHKPGIGVAIVSEGAAVGIDVELPEDRSDEFEKIALTEGERALLPVENEARREWLARFWTAKEATAKASGRGLEGKPRDFVVSDVAGERLTVNGEHVESKREGDWIVSWTHRG